MFLTQLPGCLQIFQNSTNTWQSKMEARQSFDNVTPIPSKPNGQKYDTKLSHFFAFPVPFTARFHADMFNAETN